MTAPYILYGFNPSPYSVKMRAILRYRRIPFIWRATGNPRDVAVAAGLPPVIPVLQFPDGRLMNDSTPLAHALEREHPGERSTFPTIRCRPISTTCSRISATSGSPR